MLKRIETATAVLLTLLAVALHIARALHAGGLWRDEAGALQVATLPTLGEVFQRFPHEAFPMLFPTTLRTYVGVFGDSDLALRLFGMTVGIAILGALWLNARRAGTVPLASMALLGFHPAFLFYGDSIRGYGLGVLLTLLVFWAYTRLVGKLDRSTLAAAAVTAVLSVHLVLHNSAMLLGLGVAAAIVGAVRRQWRLVLAALGIGLFAALTLLPYIGPLSAAREWDVLIAEEGLGLRRIFQSLVEAIGSPALLGGWAVLLVLGAVGLRTMETDARLFRFLVIPAALGAQCGLFLVIGYPPQIWYFLPLLALAASALDGLIAGSVPRVARLVAAVGIAFLLLPAVTREALLRMTNTDLVARHLEEHAGDQDLVLVNPWFLGVSFHRYYEGKARWETIPALEDHRMHRYDLLKARMATARPLRDVLGAVRQTLRSGHRVWLVGSYTTAPKGQRPPVLGPAPGGSLWGWRDAPYSISWSLQLGAFLRNNAMQNREVRVPVDGPVSGFENLNLYEIRGWRRRKAATR
ncbi:MAG TPA: hypothetical protein VN493_10915 [Thermoanaerobaculia bacterium]|nr:hypothetical protein [Thermoanaerobaculia bacterium]